MTDAENKLWFALRRNQLNSANFRRQHPLGSYVLDFYCPSLRLAVEIDGGQHGQARRRASDAGRTQWLEAKGIRVVRFWNNDVLGNLEGVLSDLARHAEARREELRTPALTPSLSLPLAGGGNGRTLDIVFGEVDR